MARNIFALVFIASSIFSLKSFGATGTALLTDGKLSLEDEAIVLASCRKVDELFGTHRAKDEDLCQKATRNNWTTLFDHKAQQLHLVKKGEELTGEPAPESIIYNDTTAKRFQGIIVESAPYPLKDCESAMRSTPEQIINEGILAKATSNFPIHLHDLGAPTDPVILEALKKAHPYHGYMFQEPTLIIDRTLDPTEYAATTNSAGSCVCMGVLNRETRKRGVYHTISPQGELMSFLKLIDNVAEGELANVNIMLASGFIRERTLVALDAINALMQNRLGDAFPPIVLHTFPKLRLDETWTVYYPSVEVQGADSRFSGNFAVGITVLNNTIHFLRDQDTLGIFPRVNPGTDPDLFSAEGHLERTHEEMEMFHRRIDERLQTKRPDGILDAEWAHFKKMSQIPPDDNLPSLIEGIRTKMPPSEVRPHARYAESDF